MQIKTKKLTDTISKIEIGNQIDSTSNEINGNIELDIENQSIFIEAINVLLEDGINNFIIDMQFISYIDSSGLWALFEGHKKATQKDGKVVLLNPSKDVVRVLDITKMSTKLQICHQEDDAIAAFNA